MKRTGTLRNGFTTGSAAAAAAVAAFRGGGETAEIFLPSGETLTIPIAAAGNGWAEVVKDGGDDPDVTTGATIRVRVTPFDGGTSGGADHEETSGDVHLTIRGGKGVGTATRPGLAIMPGKSAINPTPRRMIAENLRRAGCRGRFLVEISVPEGEEIAQRTMNPTLGIQGGISILGNSGIVRPYSNAAYAATLVLQLRSFAAEHGKCPAFVTGSRTAAAVARDFPEIPENAVLRIGDFIHVAVTAAKRLRFPSLVIGCMPGKLFKYACGEKNTHAARAKLAPAKLREWIAFPPEVPLEEFDTMGELEHALPPEQYRTVLAAVYGRALAVLQEWGGSTRILLALYDNSGGRIL